jgi:hypothetical protein
VSNSAPIAQTSIIAPAGRRQSNAPEGSAASGKALGEVARLSPDEALQRLSSTAGGLTPGQIEELLGSVGPNQVTLPQSNVLCLDWDPVPQLVEGFRAADLRRRGTAR